MLEKITGTFSSIVKTLSGNSKITEKNIEDTVEQNDNSFDGIINNTPSMDELEEKASRGELVSVMDMANAAKADKQKEKLAKKSEQKRSIRGYLKEASAKQQEQPKDKTKEKEKGVEL